MLGFSDFALAQFSTLPYEVTVLQSAQPFIFRLIIVPSEANEGEGVTMMYEQISPTPGPTFVHPDGVKRPWLVRFDDLDTNEELEDAAADIVDFMEKVEGLQ